jgi:hypothetical protein
LLARLGARLAAAGARALAADAVDAVAQRAVRVQRAGRAAPQLGRDVDSAIALSCLAAAVQRRVIGRAVRPVALRAIDAPVAAGSGRLRYGEQRRPAGLARRHAVDGLLALSDHATAAVQRLGLDRHLARDVRHGVAERQRIRARITVGRTRGDAGAGRDREADGRDGRHVGRHVDLQQHHRLLRLRRASATDAEEKQHRSSL